MKYLLDTHVLLWWLSEPNKISTRARKIISDRKNKMFVSSASFWEMSIKKTIGRLQIPSNLIDTVVYDGFELLPITAREGIAVSDLPFLHKDPFDRMLIIQAKLNDLVLITKDTEVMKYDVISVKA